MEGIKKKVLADAKKANEIFNELLDEEPIKFYELDKDVVTALMAILDRMNIKPEVKVMKDEVRFTIFGKEVYISVLFI